MTGILFLIPTADAASNTRRVASISAPPASIPSLLGPNDVARWMSELLLRTLVSIHLFGGLVGGGKRL